MNTDEEFEWMLDDIFHGSAWAAFIEEAALHQGPPPSEAVRIRAYRYYEEALRKKNARAFGLLKDRDIDGVEYQQEIRSEWESPG